MPGASLPNTDALVTWSDNVDNWRSADADFLQKRAILRFSSSTTRDNTVGPSGSVPVPAEGQVTYVSNGGVDGKGGLEYVDNTYSWRPLLSVKNLGLSDTSSSFGMRLSSDSSPSVALETNRAVLGINRILSVEASKLVFKTGAATAELSTDTDSFVSNIKISAPSIAVSTSITTSSLTATGTLSGASVTASGALTGNTLVAGSSTLGATAVTTLTASSAVTGVSVYGTTSVRGGSVLVSGTKVSNDSAANQFLDLSTGATLAGDSVVIAPTSPTSAVRYRTSSGAPFALVVVSATDPGLSSYPDGTIWIQP